MRCCACGPFHPFLLCFSMRRRSDRWPRRCVAELHSGFHFVATWRDDGIDVITYVISGKGGEDRGWWSVSSFSIVSIKRLKTNYDCFTLRKGRQRRLFSSDCGWCDGDETVVIATGQHATHSLKEEIHRYIKKLPYIIKCHSWIKIMRWLALGPRKGKITLIFPVKLRPWRKLYLLELFLFHMKDLNFRSIQLYAFICSHCILASICYWLSHWMQE